MEVLFLGTGTTVPSAARGPPGLLVKAGEDHLPFDMGPGSLRKVVEAGADLGRIDHLFFTHAHPDHVADLLPFLHASRWTPGLRRGDLWVVGPKEVRAFGELLLAFEPFNIRPRGYRVRFQVVGEDTVEGPGWKVLSRPVAHGIGAVGYRVECGGKTLAYSGDTDYCTGIVELGRDADLLILECSFPDGEKVPNHLTPSEAGRIASEAGAKRLALTHFYPACHGRDIKRECSSRYGGEIVMAEDGMRLRV